MFFYKKLGTRWAWSPRHQGHALVADYADKERRHWQETPALRCRCCQIQGSGSLHFGQVPYILWDPQELSERCSLIHSTVHHSGWTAGF